MAKYFRTPNVDIKPTRVKDGKVEKSLEATLLDKIDEDSLGTTDTNSSYLTSTSNSEKSSG